MWPVRRCAPRALGSRGFAEARLQDLSTQALVDALWIMGYPQPYRPELP